MSTAAPSASSGSVSVPVAGTQVTVPGTLVAGFNEKDPSSEEAKYLRLRTYAKWISGICAALLAFVSFYELFSPHGQGASTCNGLMVRVTMGWMGVIGVLWLLAELEVKLIRKYVHFLAYRSGRAAMGMMTGTILMAAAPNELPMAASGYAYTEGAMVLSIRYHLLVVGFLVVCAAIYNIHVSVKAKFLKGKGHTRNKLHDEDESHHDEEPTFKTSSSAGAKKSMM